MSKIGVLSYGIKEVLFHRQVLFIFLLILT